MISNEILEDLLEDSPCKKVGLCDEREGHGCLLREIVKVIGMGDKMAEQLKLVYDYKYMISKKEGHDIGKDRAWDEFAIQYGEKFSEVYQEGMTNGELFEKVFGFEKEHTDADVKAHIRNN